MQADQGHRRHSPRIHAARAALLDAGASSLLEQVRGVFCESTRSQMMRALAAGPLSVTELALVVGRSKWATSQHLRILRQNAMVQSSRRGRAVYYSLADSAAARSATAALDLVVSAAA